MLLDKKTAGLPPEDITVVAGDLNRHIGAIKDRYRCHGSFIYGTTRVGRRVSANMLTLTTSFLFTRSSRSLLVFFYTGKTIEFAVVGHRV